MQTVNTRTNSKCVGIQLGDSVVLFAGITLNEFVFGVRWMDNAFIFHFGIFELGVHWA